MSLSAHGPEEGATVWLYGFDPDDLDEGAGTRLLEVLDPGERERLGCFRPLATRQLFLAAHGLVRGALAHHAGVAAADWRFRSTERGKPFLDPDHHLRPLPFSLSHTRSLALCALSPAFEVGADAEWVEPALDLPALAAQVLAAVELEGWLGLPEPARVRAFFRYWTLKEALLKATGLGLSCSPREITFALGSLGQVTALRLPAAAGPPTSWRFLEFEPTPGHACAVAARTSEPVRCAYRRLQWPELASWL
jgi:4'-phosphopantetheinyl transferase